MNLLASILLKKTDVISFFKNDLCIERTLILLLAYFFFAHSEEKTGGGGGGKMYFLVQSCAFVGSL